MRLSTQIAAASIVAVLAVLAIGIFSHLYVRAVVESADEIAEEWNEMDAITGALAVLRRYGGDAEGRAELLRQSERLATFAARRGSAASADEHEDSETNMFARLAGLLRRAARENGAQIDAVRKEAEDLTISFWQEDIGRVPERLGAIRSRQRRLRAINIGTGVVLLLVPALVLAFLQLRIARPLARIQANVARIGGPPAAARSGSFAMTRLEKIIAEMVASVEAQRRELEAQVETRTQQLRHANRLGGLGRISAAVAHEINTPLASIALCLEGLKRALSEQPIPRGEIEGYLATAAGQIEACTTTTRKLLSYAHLRPQASVHAGAARLVHEALELVQPHCRTRGVTVEVDIDPATPEIHGDLAQLRQVLVNLVLNAADASPRGEVIRIEAGPAPGGLALRVRDRGPGIPEESREEIFNPFFTTKRVGEGTGLGLSISREIVEAHGGELTLVADDGHPGATFRVRLPARVGAAS
jgi:signal transduction histidine kinase